MCVNIHSMLVFNGYIWEFVISCNGFCLKKNSSCRCFNLPILLLNEKQQLIFLNDLIFYFSCNYEVLLGLSHLKINDLNTHYDCLWIYTRIWGKKYKIHKCILFFLFIWRNIKFELLGGNPATRTWMILKKIKIQQARHLVTWVC